MLPNRSDYKLNELAGVCICADCGGPLSKYEAKRKRQNKNGTESLYHVKVLRCLNNKCMNVRYNDVEEAILDYLKYLQALNDNDLTKHLGSVIQSHENKNNIRSKKQMNEQFEQREKELKTN